jgi:hypothetical protein
LLQERERKLLEDDQKHQMALMEKEKKLYQMRIKSEEDIRIKAEQQLAQIRESFNLEIKYAQDQILAEQEKRGELEKLILKLEQQIKNMRHSMDLWKLDYHKSITQKFKKLMGEVELKAKKEVEEFARKQLEEEEKRLAEELRKKEEELRKYKEMEEELQLQSFEQQQQELQEKRKEKENAKAREQFEKYRQRLFELWNTLETNVNERFNFLWETELLDRYSPELIEIFKKEVERLSDQLPLMENITRREFIKQRMREFKRTSNDPSRHYNNDPGRIIREEKQKQELERELRRLEEQLFNELPAYEKRYGVAFSYKGRQYLSILKGETKP